MSEAGDDVAELLERLVSKSWRTRSEALDELQRRFSAMPRHAQGFFAFAGALARTVDDIYPPVQEKALDAVKAFLAKAPAQAVSLAASDVAAALLRKASGSRDSARAKAAEALLLLIEAGAADAAVAELRRAAADRVPRVALFALFALREAVRQLGIPPLPGAALVPTLLSSFEHSVQEVRAEAVALAAAMHAWMGDDLRRALGGLRPAQLKELDAAFAATGRAERNSLRTPIRGTGADSPVPPKMKRRISTGTSAELPVEPSSSVVSVATTTATASAATSPPEVLSVEWFKTVEEGDGNARRAALECFAAKFSKMPKPKPSDLSRLMGALLRAANDTNPGALPAFLKALEQTALVLRREFAPHAKKLLPLLLDRLKKASAIAVHSTLDSIFASSLIIGDILDSVSAAISNKSSPKIRVETLFWLDRCVAVSKASALRDFQHQLCETLVRGIDDSPEVKKIVFSIIAHIIETLKDSFTQAAFLVEKLDRPKLQMLCSLLGYKGEAVALFFQTPRGPPQRSLSGPHISVVAPGTQRSQQSLRSVTSKPHPARKSSGQASISPPTAPQQAPSVAPENPASEPPASAPAPVLEAMVSPRRRSGANPELGFAITRRDSSSDASFSPPQQTASEEIPDTALLAVAAEMRDLFGQFSARMQGSLAQLDGHIARGLELRKIQWQAAAAERRELRHQNTLLRKELETETRVRREKEQHISEIEAQLAAFSPATTQEQLRALGVDGLTKLEQALEESISRVRAARMETVRLQNMCAHCGQAPKQVVTLPCRHRCLCAACSEAVSSCPICKAPIESRINVYD